MKIKHFRSKCIGCRSCEAVCPKFFEIGQDGMAVLKGAREKDGCFELEVEDIDCVKEASQVCPVQIIVIGE
ncbi:MAG: hypothetical protein UV40_C0005G0016 [Parcubacteria group bacterium GW2011_GWA1_42_7]|nr:MAG: hypothetical protein UV34_C0009G0018 [Parcubacteria group bacterium GW2011_GWB1_42_6]KKS70113.1 MAG: hypothetical protein UV40_C0005G0016 [Parcubacteria group bacterium GW2011_GWA1_42_7]KKS92475.1 MAG: hypothetical protein UV67_C0003G0027 [Parcubacteria group bacterium GW2011_GWC1_43_12]